MDLRKERTLKYLTQSLTDLMREKPLDQISVSEICEHAMVRRATFYRHFADKAQLLDYIISAQREKLSIMTLNNNPALDELPLLDYCKAKNRKLLELVSSNLDLIRLQHNNAYFSSKVIIIGESITADFIHRLTAERGETEPSLATTQLAAFYSTGVIGAFANWATHDDDPDGTTLIAVLDSIVDRVLK